MISKDDAKKVQDAILSHASATGHFDRVGGHTPKNAPGHGITAAITLGRIRFAPSGLAATTLRLDWRVELYRPMESSPEEIDPELAAATIALFGRITGDLTLGGLVNEIPVLGAGGAEGLIADQRYVRIDGAQYRLVVITVPTLHDDVLTQAR